MVYLQDDAYAQSNKGSILFIALKKKKLYKMEKTKKILWFSLQKIEEDLKSI